MATEKSTFDLTMVYVGVARGKNGKRLQSWIPVTDDEIKEGKFDIDKLRNYAHLATVGRPGVIYRFKEYVDDPGTIAGGQPEFVAEWPDDKQRSVWQAHHDTLRDKMDLEAKGKKAGKRNLIFEQLEDVRAYYQALPVGIQRTLFIARLIEFFTRGR